MVATMARFDIEAWAGWMIGCMRWYLRFEMKPCG
jgi:hypothetical protein